MAGRLRRAAPAELSRLAARFAAWRFRRPPGSRLPPALWAAAVGVADRHGISRTAAALKVGYYALERRVEERRTAGQRMPPPTPKTSPLSPFVELSSASLAGVPLGRESQSPDPAECVLEFHKPDGLKMRFELRGLDVAELVALGRGFWSSP